jgi:YfiH family protein
MGVLNPDWLMPQWPAPAHVHALCSTRFGGVSKAPYDALNLGDHVGDDPSDVATNRAIYSQALGAQTVFLSQVHGLDVLQINRQTPQASQADACITDQPGLACSIMVADCLPVLFTTTKGQWVAAAHAGWRGLAGPGGIGILEKTHECFMALEPINKAHEATKIIAWLGPCIGPKAFEVGSDVRTTFMAHEPLTQRFFKEVSQDKWLADLAGLASWRLQELGIDQIFGNDSTPPWCTVSNPSRFFSHRRDRVSGRFAVSIWRD